jgi:hypothetical protein
MSNNKSAQKDSEKTGRRRPNSYMLVLITGPLPEKTSVHLHRLAHCMIVKIRMLVRSWTNLEVPPPSLSLSLTDIKTPRTAYYRSLENFKLKKTPVLILFSSGHLQLVAVALATEC